MEMKAFKELYEEFSLRLFSAEQEIESAANEFDQSQLYDKMSLEQMTELAKLDIDYLK